MVRKANKKIMCVGFFFAYRKIWGERCLFFSTMLSSSSMQARHPCTGLWESVCVFRDRHEEEEEEEDATNAEGGRGRTDSLHDAFLP